MYKKYAFFLYLMSLGRDAETAQHTGYHFKLLSLPFEIQAYIFSFLPPKKQVSTVSFISSTFEKLIKKSEKYRSFFDKNVINDIKGKLFNIEIAHINKHYETIYKKYFLFYSKPENIDFIYENQKKNQTSVFKIREVIYKKQMGVKSLQLFQVTIDGKNIGNILVLKEPPRANYYVNEIGKINKEGTYNNIKRIVFKESWYAQDFESIYKHIMSQGFLVEHMQLPCIKFKNILPSIVKNNQTLEKIFLVGNMFADKVTLCNDARFMPANICSFLHINEQNENIIFPYFIANNFSFDLLLEIVKSKNTVWLQKLQKKYDLNINMLSYKGNTLLEKVLPDRDLMNFILQHRGNINKKNLNNKTIFDKVILKLIDKRYDGDRLGYYESYLFLDIHNAQQYCTTREQFEKAGRQLKKYYFQTLKDILA